MIVDDRVPTAYCSACRTVLFRRTLEEHECPMPGGDRIGPALEQAERDVRHDLAVVVARLVLFFAALGAGIFLLAWVQS